MRVNEVLNQKGRQIACIPPDASLARLVSLLASQKIGSAIIRHPSGPIYGIVSERDIVSALAEHGETVLARPIRDFVVHPFITTTPAKDVRHVMALMTRERVRHVAVMDGAELCGLISLGDTQVAASRY